MMSPQSRDLQRRLFGAALHARGVLLAVIACAAIVLAGCGGESPTGVPVTYVVSEDFGGHLIAARKIAKLGRAPTVIRLLQREFDDVGTSYGGRFITSIGGRRAKADPPTDWLFYVNGREAERGGADIRLHPGDHVQWDLHRWDASREMTRTVGAFPHPFVGDPPATRVALVCRSQGGTACDLVRKALRTAAVKFAEGVTTRSRDVIVVGQWHDVTNHDGVPDLSYGPDVTGVFATFTHDELILRGADGERGLVFGAGSGLVAAVERGDTNSTWIVAGIDRSGTERAARLVNRETLRNRFAVAADEESVTSIPVGD